MTFSVTSEPDHPGIGGAHHLGFSVTDLDSSIRFYCDVLGAAVIRPSYTGDNPSFAGRMAIVRLGATALDLFEHAGNTGQRFDPQCTGLDHLGFAAESVQDLERWARWLDACGVPHSAIREIVAGDTGDTVPEPHGAMFDLVDPDGIQLEFLFIDIKMIQEAGIYRIGTPDAAVGPR